MSDTRKNLFETAEEAREEANRRNAEPLGPGKEKRAPQKVYAVSNGIKTVFSVAQAPTPALYNAAFDLGMSCEHVEGETLAPVDSYLSKLTPAQLEQARKYLAQ